MLLLGPDLTHTALYVGRAGPAWAGVCVCPGREVGQCGQDMGRGQGYRYRRTLRASARTPGSRGVTWAGLGFLWGGMEVTRERQLNSVWIRTNRVLLGQMACWAQRQERRQVKALASKGGWACSHVRLDSSSATKLRIPSNWSFKAQLEMLGQTEDNTTK
uniref:Uncharacterized protein n=1 Tax=Rousettus aegyptiacus TaxID=9407 RepID=A0A7J8INI4_ROUAE|nr:hypothetical protein HJG63_010834 [Rousettus aegyptiacus]